MPSPGVTGPTRTPARTILKLALCLALAVLAAAVHSALAESAKKQAADSEYEDTLEIQADSAAYYLDEETFSIPGPVTMKTSSITIKGRDLTFNGSISTGALEGDPVEIIYKDNTTATAGRITVNVETDILRAEGGLTVNHKSGSQTLNMVCNGAVMNMDTGDTEAEGGIEINYVDTEAPAPAGDESGEIVLSPAHLTLDYVLYNYKNGDIHAGRKLHLTAPDVTLTAGGVSGSLEKKVVNVSNGVNIKIKDVTATAGRAVVRYGDRTASLEGGVTATRGADTLTGERVEIDGNKGRRAIRVIGPVDMKIKIKKKKKQEE